MTQKFCTSCGTALVEGAAFCVSCGAAAQVSGAAPPAPQPVMTPPAAPPPTAAAPPPLAAAPVHAPMAPPPAPPAPPSAAPPQYPGHGGFQPPPPTYPAGHPPAYSGFAAARQGLAAWTWQRWALLAVGAVVLLSVLGQTGVFDRLMNANSAVVGRWAASIRCQNAITLNADGRFLSPNGRTGRWTLRGDRLTLSGTGGSSTMRLAASTRNSITLVTEDGVRETLLRC